MPGPGPAPTCICGTCEKCLRRERARRWRKKRGYVPDPKATERVRRWREKNREAYNASERERYHTEDAEARAKRRARGRVRDAIRRGDLTRGACEQCGAKEAQAHHEDYSKPLEIRWLCSQCHAIEHMRRAA